MRSVGGMLQALAGFSTAIGWLFIMTYEEYAIIVNQCRKMLDACYAALRPLQKVSVNVRTGVIDNQITYWRNCISAYRWMAGVAWQQVMDKDGKQQQSL